MKDPAVLLYIDTWLTSTKDLRGAEKGWYLNLLLYQYDKGSLPNDIEELANLCDVRISEYDYFKQVFKQVLKQKFKQNENGRLENPKASEIIRKRETFKEKRKLSGKIGYVIKLAINELKATEEQCEFIKKHLKVDEIDVKNKQVLKQELKQIIKLYIDEDKDVIINIDFNIFWDLYNKKIGAKDKCIIKWNNLNDKERQKIIDTLPLFLKSIKEKKYQPYAETYLNQKRWNDEIKEENPYKLPDHLEM